eukprot:jgi/Botrbrau1/4396/Bobra.105_2s0041.2
MTILRDQTRTGQSDGNLLRVLTFCLLARITVSESLKILFVGNSYTYFNGGLDQLSAQILNAAGVPTWAQRVAGPDKSWGYHMSQAMSTGSDLYYLLGAGSKEQYNYVIFQEMSTWLADGNYGDSYSALEGLAKLAVSRGAAPATLLTWAWQEGCQGGDNFYSMQERVIKGYMTVTAQLRARVTPRAFIIPVGLAFMKVFDLTAGYGDWNRFYMMYSPADHNHPSLLGTYLASCVVAASLSGIRTLGNSLVDVCGSSTAAGCGHPYRSGSCWDEPACKVAPGGCYNSNGACLGNVAAKNWAYFLQGIADETVFTTAESYGFPPFPWSGSY